jgi:benzaldehyde dehydrogenase (NAD)
MALWPAAGNHGCMTTTTHEASPQTMPEAQGSPTPALMDPEVWAGRIFDGEWITAGAGEYPVVEPASGAQLGVVGQASVGDVRRAAQRAAQAQREWAETPYAVRAQVLRRSAELWDEQPADVFDWYVRESGSTATKAGFDFHLAANACHGAAATAIQPYGQTLRSEEPRLSITRRVPVGVVSVIAPFNFPLILALRSVAPALALGNAVLLKPDPRTAVCAGVAIARIFEEAGLPAGLLHVLPGGADVGEAVVTDPDVSVVAFTGSTKAGRAVGPLAAKHLKRVSLELGGKNALIVMDDVDVDHAVASGAWGAFFHQGQICMAAGRILVHESIVGDYVERLATTADALTVGDPAGQQVDLGPIIDEHQRDNIHKIVTASVDAGARLAAGGSFADLFYRPTVLSDVAPGMPAYSDEIFGPVAAVTPFSTADEAVELAADTEYGLALGILSNDVMKAIELADRIPSGLVHINDQPTNDEAIEPFGGVGASGNGSRTGGADADIAAYTDTQWLTIRGSIPARQF